MRRFAILVVGLLGIAALGGCFPGHHHCSSNVGATAHVVAR